MDLREQRICAADVCGVQEVLLVTNTKFTSSAEKYANCVGLTLLSWSTPKGNTLQDRIDKAKIYPVTALSLLSLTEKRLLIENGVILCRELLKKPQLLHNIGVSKKKVDTVLNEARQLCST
jgi:hypothetical protein